MSLRVVHALLVRLVIFIVNTKMRIFLHLTEAGLSSLIVIKIIMSVVCCFRKWPYKDVLTCKDLPPNP